MSSQENFHVILSCKWRKNWNWWFASFLWYGKMSWLSVKCFFTNTFYQTWKVKIILNLFPDFPNTTLTIYSEGDPEWMSHNSLYYLIYFLNFGQYFVTIHFDPAWSYNWLLENISIFSLSNFSQYLWNVINMQKKKATKTNNDSLLYYKPFPVI